MVTYSPKNKQLKKSVSKSLAKAEKKARRANENYNYLKIFSIIFLIQFLSLIFVFSVAIDKFFLHDEEEKEQVVPLFEYTSANICQIYPDVIEEQPVILYDKNDYAPVIEDEDLLPLTMTMHGEESEEALNDWIEFLNNEVKEEVRELEKKFSKN